MGLKETMLLECQRQVDEWIEAFEEGGQDPLSQVVLIQEYGKHFAEKMGNVESGAEGLVAIPVGIAAPLFTMASIASHCIVTRLVETGKVTEERVGFGAKT